MALLGIDGHSTADHQKCGSVRHGRRFDRGARVEVGASNVRVAEAIRKRDEADAFGVEVAKGSVAPWVKWMTRMWSYYV